MSEIKTDAGVKERNPSAKGKVKERKGIPFTEKKEHLSLFSDFDIHLFKAGKLYHLYNKLGSHVVEHNGEQGVYFAVWAPNAIQVQVIGNFNGWNKQSNQLLPRWDGSGIWEGFIPGLKQGEYYKYHIKSFNGYESEKGDPYAFHWETPPRTGSVVWDLPFKWTDQKWMKERKNGSPLDKPMAVYEMHLGSWRKVPEEGGRFMTYREIAETLPGYLQYMGFTHVEFMPVMEHPFFGSWGYQITGYYAPSSRFGTPQDFMYLVNALHKAGIGVILDWVPSHFPLDMHGLHLFDGTHLYEHEDPRRGFHPDWKSGIFNYGRNEVRAFLISNALYWLDKYHIDGLRVDAVASMLYLDYSRNEGEWLPNVYGGRENLEAIEFLQEFNNAVHNHHPDVFTVAEESTAYPGVTHSTDEGGLGFDMKWMMGWMHDTLKYFRIDPVYRRFHQNTITFSIIYAFSENFILPLSHDEVVHGKGPLIDKMPGDRWQKFANLRSMYAYMYAHPGGKLLFMGGEFAQNREWSEKRSLDWHLLDDPLHRGLQSLVQDLNGLYKKERALYVLQYEEEGFEWIDMKDVENSVLAFIRKSDQAEELMVVVCNLTPLPRYDYRLGMPHGGAWKEVFNSDGERYGGSGMHNPPQIQSERHLAHEREWSVVLTLPPLGVVFLKEA